MPHARGAAHGGEHGAAFEPAADRAGQHDGVAFDHRLDRLRTCRVEGGRRESRGRRRLRGDLEARPTSGTRVAVAARMPTDAELVAIDAYWRAANYLTVGQIYL